MKTFTLTLLVISMSMLCVLNISPVLALEYDDITLSPDWSPFKFYQGDTVSLKLILANYSPETLTIYYLGVHFDWMEADSFHGRDLSDDPITVESQEVYVFDPMAISLPSDVSVDLHNYTIALEGTEGEDNTSFSWDSQSKQMYIQPAEKKTFDTILQDIVNILNENATYQSPEAKALYEKFEDEYSQAFGYGEQWDDANSHLQNALSYLEQAEEAEQQSSTQNTDLQRLLLIIAPIATVVIVSIVVIIVWHRRTQSDTEEDQTQETQNTPLEE